MAQSLNSLILLRVEKKQVLEILKRLPRGDSAYNDVREEINLIEKVIMIKQGEKGNGNWA